MLKRHPESDAIAPRPTDAATRDNQGILRISPPPPAQETR
ncbi:Hypothetical protein CAP_8732 [Chondromyces apiculatus DSM 436]|uniref:Uncharacterized protein n=1 Tax=Chondromyces apiculatus DSM 436 TaxID=1192034 RepID=A0A017SWX3_9BACT|nr:Hypothetical protein CAP_8732 [Chondromyces apiculatus DSM 436]